MGHTPSPFEHAQRVIFPATEFLQPWALGLIAGRGCKRVALLRVSRSLRSKELGRSEAPAPRPPLEVRDKTSATALLKRQGPVLLSSDARRPGAPRSELRQDSQASLQPDKRSSRLGHCSSKCFLFFPSFWRAHVPSLKPQRWAAPGQETGTGSSCGSFFPAQGDAAGQGPPTAQQRQSAFAGEDHPTPLAKKSPCASCPAFTAGNPTQLLQYTDT